MRRSFSILESFILLALVAAVAMVAIPLWASERIVSNEEQAGLVLRQIAAAQGGFHSRNGTYGLLTELTGTPSPRNLTVEPACLDAGDPWLGALEIEDSVLLTSLLDPTISVESIVIRVAPDVRALPERLWVDPTIPEYGRVALVRGTLALGLAPGERVLVRRPDPEPQGS